MERYQKYEKCERKALLKLHEQMNYLHADMGGRDRRPERIALIKCMDIITQELDRKTA
jgi:hypothetical protein